MDYTFTLRHWMRVTQLLYLTCWLSEVGADVNLIKEIHSQVTASQSSTWCPAGYCHNASNGVDLNENRFVDCKCCAATLKTPSWWKLDLGAVYSIQKIIFIGRNESALFQSRNFVIDVVVDGTDKLIYQNNASSGDTWFEIPLNPPVALQILTIKHSTTSLTFCELKLIESDVCPVPYFYRHCNQTCHCLDKQTCNKTSGICQSPGCEAGWKGDSCIEACGDASFGVNCSFNCHCHAEDTCDRFHGNCSSGICASGWIGENCSTPCYPGTFGQNCSFICHCKHNVSCNHTSGECETCAPGWQGNNCSTVCDSGSFGDQCLRHCHCYKNASCDPHSGICSSELCATGYRRSSCSEKCESGTFGQNCSFECHCDNHEACDHISGSCDVCAPGWQGTNCSTVCNLGSFGYYCSQRCHCYKNARCDSTNGTCSNGLCEAGWHTHSCSQELLKENEHPKSTAVIIGPVVGILIIAAVVVAVVLYRRHSRRDYSAKRTSLSTKDTHHNTEYENAFTTDDREHEYEVINNAGLTDVISVRQLWHQVKLMYDDSFKNAYMDFESQLSVRKDAHVSDQKKTDKHKRVEFKVGENVRRYHSDANYIDGCRKDDKYIAVKGPSNEVEAIGFWEMVFQLNISLIVMVQDAKAKRKAHAFQYWYDGAATYGEVIVKTTKFTASSDIAIRDFEIIKKNKRKSVIQIQFTGSFTNNTPRNLHSFLVFWRKSSVLAEKIHDPIVVHCSDGIRVTGLYIAIDILYAQVMAEESVNLREIIGRLRHQRRNVIQTQEQFRFLLDALLEALYIPVKAVEASEFESFCTCLTANTTTSGKTWMTFQYDLLFGDVSAYSDLQQVENEHTYSSLTGKKQRGLSADAPTLLEGRGPLLARLQNYAHKDAFILTSVDDKTSFDQFWRMIDERQVQTVVCLDIDILNLFNSDDQVYSIHLMESRKEHGYAVNTYAYKRKHLMEVKVNSVTSFCYEESLPGNVTSAVSFVRAIQSCQPEFTDRHPVLLACRSNTNNLSVIYVLLHENERLRFSGQISIIHAGQHLKERSEQFVPSIEEYTFCHSVMLDLANESIAYADIDANTSC